MAGKTKQQKKRRAKMQKQVGEQLRRKPKKIVATQAGDEVNNNLEQSPPKVNEDAQKDAAMVGITTSGIPFKPPISMVEQPIPEEIKVLEAEELASAKEQGESEREALESKPFDPKDIVANALKKYGV